MLAEIRARSTAAGLPGIAVGHLRATILPTGEGLSVGVKVA